MDIQSTRANAEFEFKNILNSVTGEMQVCIQNCMTCSQVCEQSITYCLGKGGMHAEESHIRLLQDCVDICDLSAKYMVRGSAFHSGSCAVCAEVCLACAEDCERMDDDDIMKMCADICRRCAESCQKMSVQH